MARLAGRNGRVYLGIASAAAVAEPLPFVANWSLSFASDRIEVTAMGDSRKTYVAGLSDAQGEFSGFFDDATNQTYTAAVDGIARRFYLYPSTLDTTKYFWGTVIVDMSINAGVAGAVEMQATWNSATDIQRQGV